LLDVGPPFISLRDGLRERRGGRESCGHCDASHKVRGAGRRGVGHQVEGQAPEGVSSRPPSRGAEWQRVRAMERPDAAVTEHIEEDGEPRGKR
jgi:hypothetical protein